MTSTMLPSTPARPLCPDPFCRSPRAGGPVATVRFSSRSSQLAVRMNRSALPLCVAGLIETELTGLHLLQY
jgi:hypothetical protein